MKKERQGLNIFFKMYHDLRIYYEKIKSSNKDLIPIWRRDIKIIESKFGGSYSSYFIFARQGKQQQQQKKKKKNEKTKKKKKISFNK